MIKLMFSRRHKRKVYRLDATVNGKRFRKFFFRRSDAEAVAYKIKHDEVSRRYGLPVMADRPFLSDLIEKRLITLDGQPEYPRARRVLNGFLALMSPGYCVDELTKADIQKWVDKRRMEGLKPQSINRELVVIGAMLNQVDIHYPQLEQWRPPRIPKQKVLDGRRDRVWESDEIESVLAELFAPPMKGEQPQAALARHRTGKKLAFCLMSGVRHGEMAGIHKTDINWQSKIVRIKQKKTGKFKTVGPLAEQPLAILREFYETTPTEFVFNRGGKINRRIYKILRAACQRAGVSYGQRVINGLVLHDARHTATTHMLESGINPRTVQEWMGWANSSFVLYYAHASKKSREKAGRALGELAGKKTA